MDLGRRKIEGSIRLQKNMDIFRKKKFEKIYTEEDLFPREITHYEKRDYGVLFYNEENKDSNDSNHAVIYRKKIADLDFVIKDIIDFYTHKNITRSGKRQLVKISTSSRSVAILSASG